MYPSTANVSSPSTISSPRTPLASLPNRVVQPYFDEGPRGAGVTQDFSPTKDIFWTHEDPFWPIEAYIPSLALDMDTNDAALHSLGLWDGQDIRNGVEHFQEHQAQCIARADEPSSTLELGHLGDIIYSTQPSLPEHVAADFLHQLRHRDHGWSLPPDEGLITSRHPGVAGPALSHSNFYSSEEDLHNNGSLSARHISQTQEFDSTEGVGGSLDPQFPHQDDRLLPLAPPSPLGNRQSKSPVERSFVCEICQRRFARKATLKDHRRTHRDISPSVRCEETGCDKKYGRQADLTRHIRSAHVKEKYRCNFCRKTFGRTDILKRHIAVSCHTKPVNWKIDPEASFHGGYRSQETESATYVLPERPHDISSVTD